MDTDNYRWLLYQIPELSEKKIIDSQSAENLRDFCSKKLVQAAEIQQGKDRQEQALNPFVPAQNEVREPKKPINWVPLILTVASGVLVAGGLISLIAYNWAFISRTTKTIAAVVILLGIQAAVLICKLNGKMEKTAVRESLGIGWAIMFGAMIAFISQILRLPSNTSAFIALWAASSVLVLYSTKSDTVFYFTLILGIAYITSTKYYGDSSSLIYILFASLIPYSIIRKNVILKWFLIIYAVCMMGFCLDKTVPGLWIVAYTSLLAIFAMSKNKETSYVFLSGLAFMLILLCFGYFWKDIGWHFIRTSPSHHLDGSILDIILTLSLFAYCIGLALFRTFIKKEKNRINLVAIIPSVIAILYCVYSVFSDEIKITAPAISVLILMGFIITTIIAMWHKTPVYIAGLCGILLQFVICSFDTTFDFNLLGSFFCILLYLVSLISIRITHFKLEYKPALFTVFRIMTMILYLALLLFLIPYKKTSLSETGIYIFNVIYSIVILCSIILTAKFIGRKRFVHILDLMAFPSCGCIISMLSNQTVFAEYASIIILTVMAVLGIYSLMIKNKGRMSSYVFAIPILFIPFTSFIGSFILFILTLCITAWCMAIYSLYNNKTMGVLAVIVAAIAFMFTSYSNPGFNFVLWEITSAERFVSFFAALALFILTGILAAREMIKNKKWLNPFFFIHPLLIAIVVCIPHEDFHESTDFICSICFVLLALSCIYYLIKASSTSSIWMANCATVFLGLFVFVKFFVEDFSLIAKGLVFIGLGVAFFLINIFLSRRNKNEK